MSLQHHLRTQNMTTYVGHTKGQEQRKNCTSMDNEGLFFAYLFCFVASLQVNCLKALALITYFNNEDESGFHTKKQILSNILSDVQHITLIRQSP